MRVGAIRVGVQAWLVGNINAVMQAARQAMKATCTGCGGGMRAGVS